MAEAVRSHIPSRLAGSAFVAVDAGGSLYFADVNSLIVKLPAGSGTQVKLSFPSVWGGPFQIAANTAGDLFLVESVTEQVLKLPFGSNASVELPFAGLKGPQGVAVDTAGDVYVTTNDNRVLKFAAR